MSFFVIMLFNSSSSLFLRDVLYRFNVQCNSIIDQVHELFSTCTTPIPFSTDYLEVIMRAMGSFPYFSYTLAASHLQTSLHLYQEKNNSSEVRWLKQQLK